MADKMVSPEITSGVLAGPRVASLLAAISHLTDVELFTLRGQVEDEWKARRRTCVITCDYPGCGATFTSDGGKVATMRAALNAGWSVSHVRSCLCAQHRRPRGRPPGPSPNSRWRALLPGLVQDVVAGMSLRDLAKKHEVSFQYIAQVLAQADMDDATRAAIVLARKRRNDPTAGAPAQGPHSIQHPSEAAHA